MSELNTLNHQNPIIINIIDYTNVGIKKGRRKKKVDVGKQNSKIGRKRKHDQSRKEKRDNKYSNISYINSKDQQVLPKVFEDFNCNCKLKCPENIPAAERLQEFEKFHSLGTYTNQNLYLLERVEENFKKRCYTRNKESKTQRTFSRIYHIKDVRVCKEMFVKTFQISPGRVSTVLNKVRKGDGLIDRRGTANGGHNRTSDELVTEVFNHIRYVLKTKGLPTKRTKRRKLQPERTTIKSMYDMYKNDKLTTGIVSFSTYKAMYYKHIKSSEFLQSFDDEPNPTYLKPGDYLQILIEEPKSKHLKSDNYSQSFNDKRKPTVINNIVPDKQIMPIFSSLEHQSFCSCDCYDDVKTVPVQFHNESISETTIPIIQLHNESISETTIPIIQLHNESISETTVPIIQFHNESISETTIPIIQLHNESISETTIPIIQLHNESISETTIPIIQLHNESISETTVPIIQFHNESISETTIPIIQLHNESISETTIPIIQLHNESISETTIPIIQLHNESISETTIPIIQLHNESISETTVPIIQFHNESISETTVPIIQLHNESISETNIEKSCESKPGKQFHDIFVSETNLKKSNESICPSEPEMLQPPQCYEIVIPPPEIIYEVKIEPPSIQEPKVTKCKRKVRGRKAGVQTREERKNNKYSNTEYLNTKNEKVLPKIFKEFDCHCNNKCAENITVDERSKLFEQFHNLGSYSAQNLFLLERVEEMHKKRCYTKNKQKQERTYTRIYTFNDIKVCKEFFVKTLQISPSRVNTVLTKVRDGQGLSDQRGIAIGGHNRISHESRIEVIHHISTIIMSTSPNWMDTKVGCPFTPEYTFKKMYDMYKGSYQSEVVSFSTYKAIFYKEFGRPTMDWQFS